MSSEVKSIHEFDVNIICEYYCGFYRDSHPVLPTTSYHGDHGCMRICCLYVFFFLILRISLVFWRSIKKWPSGEF